MQRLLIGAFAAVVAASALTAQDPAALVAAKGEAVVHVYVRVEKERDRFGKDWFKDETNKRSGAIVDPSGLVLTHWGVVAESLESDGSAKAGHSLQVQLRDGAVCGAEVVAKDLETDLALLRIEPPEGVELAWFELADSDSFVAGEPAVAMGFQDGETFSVFAGVASRASGGAELGARLLAADELVLSDASIRPSNHGGPLVDRHGRLLGLCNAKFFVEPKAEPTPEDLAEPSFGVAIRANVIRAAFRAQFSKPGLANATLALAPRGGDPAPWAAAVARVAPSVVCVHAGTAEPPELGAMDPYARQRTQGVGSGVVVDSSGLVLTNLHIVQPDPRSVRVTTSDGKAWGAEVVARDESLNVALLRVASSSAKLPYAELGSSEDTLKGERVFAVGNPRGRAIAVGTGVVSATNRSARVGGSWIPTAGLLQIDAPVDPGNTGGPVIDLTGRVIGILNAGEREEIVAPGEQKKETNIGFAIPIDRVRRIFREGFDANAGANQTITSAPQPTEEEMARRSSAITGLAASMAQSLVNVYVSVELKRPDTFDPFAQDEQLLMTRGLGSGVIIDAAGLALTNWHVIDGADGVHVRTGADKQYPATVLSSSRIDDLALLQLELADGESVVPVELGDSGALRVGDTVVAIGNPYGHANTVTAGVLSAKNQAIHIKGRARLFEGLLQTDAAINPGNSGGALLDLDGRLVGINSAGSNADAEAGYAIPVDYVREKFQTKLLSAEKLGSSYLGIEVADEEGKPVVRSINRHGPAARAGFRVGDVVRRVGASAVGNHVDFVRLTMGAQPGSPLPIELERDGEKLTLEPLPLSGVAWRAFRQTGIEVEGIDLRSEPELIRAGQIALYRQYTGDPTAEPPTLRGTAVRVVRVHPGRVDEGLEIRPGDMLLGLEVTSRFVGGGTTTKLIPFETVDSLGEAFDRFATKRGAAWPCYVYRDGKVVVVSVEIVRVS